MLCNDKVHLGVEDRDGSSPTWQQRDVNFCALWAICCGLGVLARDDLRVEVIGLAKYRRSASRSKGNEAVIGSREMSDR